VLEYLAGGELFDRLINQGAYSEADARTALFEALRAVAAMHAVGVMHRDLKPCVGEPPPAPAGAAPFLALPRLAPPPPPPPPPPQQPARARRPAGRTCC